MKNLGYRLGLGLALGALGGCTHMADYGRRTSGAELQPRSASFSQGPLDTFLPDTLESETDVSKSPGGAPSWPLRPRH